jgi:type II secretory pathway component PulF
MKWTYAQRHFLYAEMEKMLRSGFGVDQSCRALLKQKLPPASTAFLQGMVEELERGNSIAESVSHLPLDLTDLERSMITAGERGGKLEQAFGHLSEYFGVLHDTQQRVRQAMVYPVLLLHAGVLLPSIPKVIMSQGQVSFLELAVMPLLALYAVAIVVILLLRGLMDKAQTEPGADALLRRIPFVGKAREALAMGRFCRVFYMQLLAAISMSESVKAAGAAAQSGMIGEAAERVGERIVAGEALGPSLLEEPAFPVSFTTSMNTAEAAGTLDDDLGRWAIAYRDTAVSALDQAGQWYPKVFYVAVVVLVGWQILSVGLTYNRLIEGTIEQLEL